MVTKQSLLTTWITTEQEREPELRLLLIDQRPASKCSPPPPPTKLSRSATELLRAHTFVLVDLQAIATKTPVGVLVVLRHLTAGVLVQVGVLGVLSTCIS